MLRDSNEPPGASIDAVRKKIKQYRDHPVTTQGTTDSDLNPLIWRLMHYEKDNTDGPYHWFCHRADSTLRDLAAFLLRLFAYKDTGNDKVEVWKDRLQLIWASCPDCIQCMDDEKTLSGSSFFAAFKRQVLERFWLAFEAFEVQVIVNSVKGKGHLAPATITSSTLYHLLSKALAFKNPELLSLFAKKPFDPPPSTDWPLDPPPPGILLLATHEDGDVRQWALGLLKRGDRNSQKSLNENHRVTLQVLISKLNPSYTEVGPIVKEILSVFPFSSSLFDAWTAMAYIIPLIPYQQIVSLKLQTLVTTHLFDNDEHFLMVLRSFLHIMLKGGSAVWSNEQPDYPLVVFDSIKDNLSYIAIIQGSGESNLPEEVNPWYLFLPQEMLKSTWDSSIFPELAAKIFAFICDELQHERFLNKQHLISEVGMKTILSCVTRAVKFKSGLHYRSLLQIIDIHADFIFAVAFSEDRDNVRWRSAREAALHLLQIILTSDIDNLASAMAALSRPQTGMKIEELKDSSKSVHVQFWTKFYEGISGKDANAATLLLNLAARSARLDTLSKKAVQRSFISVHEAQSSKPSSELLQAVNVAVDEVNHSLASTRNGLVSCVSKFTDLQRDLLNLVGQDDVSKYLVYMLLSPVEDYNMTAQILIGQAYDVDTRSDCLRQLLNLAPRTVIQGLIDYLDEFVVHAKKVSEACSLAKALVRTMTDVIEVLGNSPDGLLKDPLFLKRNSEGSWTIQTSLPLLWTAMTASMAVIFRMTPKWAIYYDNKTMVEWMRDALIFGRDLLERRHAFEQASLPYEEQNASSAPSLRRIRIVMIGGLQDVLYEVQAWLRLTDMELLYQSFALLKSLFQSFHESNEKPLTTTLDKLKRFVSKNRGKIGRAEDKLGTFLNPSSLAELDMAIAEFDDEVQIISVKQKTKSLSPEVEIIEPPKKRKAEKAESQSRKEIGEGQEVKVSTLSKKVHRNRGPKFEGNRRHAEPTPPASSSDSESEESEAEKGASEARKSINALATIAEEYKRKEEFLKKAKPERRQIKIIDDPLLTAQVERQKKQLEARRAAFRMKPDISRLHSTILTWNYEHNGDSPPFINSKPELRPLKLLYSNYEEYQRTLEPLLMLECWAQIVKSKEEALEEHSYKIVGRSFVDQWLDLDGTSEFKSSGKQEWRLNPETDIVLLRHATEPKCIMAKVTVFKRVPDAVQIGLRCSTKAFPSDPGLRMNSIWRLSLVFSLSTLHREYAALVSLQYYDRLDFVLRPKLLPPVPPSSDEITKAMKAYRLNEPQAKAIISSLKKDGFSLIQGPPGTGKTSTICGLVGSFLSTRKKAPTPILPGKPAQKVAVPKVLVCAPSNAAVDEVAKRLMEGIWGSNGQRITPNVVRVGADRQVNVSVKEISLDYLVEHKLSLVNSGEGADGDNEMASLVAEMGRVKKLRNEKMDELKSTINNTTKIISLEREIKDLNSTRMSLNQRFNRLKDIQKSERRNLDAARRECRYEILADADVICCTLSGSGHELLEPFEFPLLIIDEAAQSVELSSLIPLKYQSAQCILVGDPKQLPPTVLSQEAMKWQYDRSFFVRMHENRPDAMHLLSIQYRMHPQISRVPSKIFYDGLLSDGPDMAMKTEQAWHAEEKLGVYKFFSASRGKEETSTIGHSQFNREECNVILALYTRLTRQFAGITFDYRIGIVSMYKQQIFELRRAFKQRFGPDILEKIDFNTVDGFQGQEKDIIILSCVRAGPSLKSIGFLSDKRRINVAITRSRSSLYIVGNAPSLQRCNETWSAIIEDARSRSCLIDLPDLTYFTTREKSAIKANPPNRNLIAEPSATIASPEQPIVKPGNENNTKTTGKRKRSINETLAKTKPSEIAEPSIPPRVAKPESSRQGDKTLLERMDLSSLAGGIAEQAAETSVESQRKAEKALELLRQRKKARNNIFMKK